MQGIEVLIPISFFATVGSVFIARSEIGKAIAQRIRGGAADQELHAELAEMRRELDQVRMDLAETHERLDFTERLLAQGRPPDQLHHG